MDVLFVQPSVAYVVTCVYHMVVVFCTLLVSTVPRENLVKNPHFTPKRSGEQMTFQIWNLVLNLSTLKNWNFSFLMENFDFGFEHLTPPPPIKGRAFRFGIRVFRYEHLKNLPTQNWSLSRRTLTLDLTSSKLLKYEDFRVLWRQRRIPESYRLVSKSERKTIATIQDYLNSC